MTKCKECGLEDSHKMSCDSAFDEKAWDEDRQRLEMAVQVTVEQLGDFMGCNSFTLPFRYFTVKVTPSNA